ncbi:MAG: hypothetical protein DWQ37_08890 [Planctomycetota bacterium]|nr:MAG: hypothetical protein DWQ37_08890 [Planctomycetota bacterium]
MPSNARKVTWLVAVALAVGACSSALAQSPGEGSRVSWPEPRGAGREDAAGRWSEPRPLQPNAAPRPLPGQNVSNRPPYAGVARQASRTVPAPAAGPPLKLTPHSNEGPSPLGLGDGPPWASVAMNLGLVLGLFLVVAWALRRGMPKGSALLPAEAVDVLGRAPLAGRQQVYLVRCGNKLVLVSPTATGVETLTEITDPAEVVRLENLCRQPTAAVGPWRQLLTKLSSTGRAIEYQGGETLDPMDFRHLETGEHYSV